jgi:hypothetical protein
MHRVPYALVPSSPSLRALPTIRPCIPLLGHRGITHPACRHLKAPVVVPPLPNTPNRLTTTTRFQTGSWHHRGQEALLCLLILIIVSTKDRGSIRELTSLAIRLRFRAMPYLTLPAATPAHISGKAMAQGMGSGSCTHLLLAQVDQGGLWRILPSSRYMRPWPRSWPR